MRAAGLCEPGTGSAIKDGRYGIGWHRPGERQAEWDGRDGGMRLHLEEGAPGRRCRCQFQRYWEPISSTVAMSVEAAPGLLWDPWGLWDPTAAAPIVTATGAAG